jgi:hypothetical protein
MLITIITILIGCNRQKDGNLNSDSLNLPQEKKTETEPIINNSEQNFSDKRDDRDSTKNQNELSKKEIIQLVEKIDPYKLEPTMTAKERYDLRTKFYSKMSNDKISIFIHAIDSSALQLQGIVSDNRYVELIDKEHPGWTVYEHNNLYGVVNVLAGVENYVDYQPLLDDIGMVKKLCNEGLEERNILKIIDANRILQDLSRHFIHVPYQGSGEAKVDYGELHNFYFKVSKTLEGAYDLLSCSK